MKIIGCHFHTRYQQIAMVDQATGEMIERRLDHQSGEAQAFYRELQGPVRVGIEATGPIRRFERWPNWATNFGLEIRRRFAPAPLQMIVQAQARCGHIGGCASGGNRAN